jgi:hypothetical protein
LIGPRQLGTQPRRRIARPTAYCSGKRARGRLRKGIQRPSTRTLCRWGVESDAERARRAAPREKGDQGEYQADGKGFETCLGRRRVTVGLPPLDWTGFRGAEKIWFAFFLALPSESVVIITGGVLFGLFVSVFVQASNELYYTRNRW